MKVNKILQMALSAVRARDGVSDEKQSSVTTMATESDNPDESGIWLPCGSAVVVEEPDGSKRLPNYLPTDRAEDLGLSDGDVVRIKVKTWDGDSRTVDVEVNENRDGNFSTEIPNKVMESLNLESDSHVGCEIWSRVISGQATGLDVLYPNEQEEDSQEEYELPDHLKEKVRNEVTTKKQGLVVEAWDDTVEDWDYAIAESDAVINAVAGKVNNWLSNDEKPIEKSTVKRYKERFIGHNRSFEDLSNRIQHAVDLLALNNTRPDENQLSLSALGRTFDKAPSGSTLSETEETFPDIISERMGAVQGKSFADIREMYGYGEVRESTTPSENRRGVVGVISDDLSKYHLVKKGDGKPVCGESVSDKNTYPLDKIEESLGLDICRDCEATQSYGEFGKMTTYELRDWLAERGLEDQDGANPTYWSQDFKRAICNYIDSLED